MIFIANLIQQKFMLVNILLHYFCEHRNKCYSFIAQTKKLLSNTVIAAQLRIDLHSQSTNSKTISLWSKQTTTVCHG